LINNNGAKIVRDKFKNQLRIFKEHPALHVCYKSIKYDYDNIKHIEYTGDMYDYFKKYEGKEKEFEELYNEYKPDGYLSNWSVCGYLERNYKDELQNRLTDYQLYQGSSYNEYEICKIFDLKNIKSRINISRSEDIIVLINKSLYTNEYFLDYKNHWEGDTLHFIGEGQCGNQFLKDENYILDMSRYKLTPIHLFNRIEDNSTDEKNYLYLGTYKLSDVPYQQIQIDKKMNSRLVYIFPLVESYGKTFDQEINDCYYNQSYFPSKWVFDKIKNLSADQAKMDLPDDGSMGYDNSGGIVPKSITTYVYEKYVRKNNVLIKRFDYSGGVYKIEKADNFFYFSRLCGVNVSHRTAVLTKADLAFVKDINNITYNEFISLLNYIIFVALRFGI